MEKEEKKVEKKPSESMRAFKKGFWKTLGVGAAALLTIAIGKKTGIIPTKEISWKKWHQGGLAYQEKQYK